MNKVNQQGNRNEIIALHKRLYKLYEFLGHVEGNVPGLICDTLDELGDYHPTLDTLIDITGGNSLLEAIASTADYIEMRLHEIKAEYNNT